MNRELVMEQAIRALADALGAWGWWVPSSPNPTGARYCLACRETESAGHAPRCPIGRALAFGAEAIGGRR